MRVYAADDLKGLSRNELLLKLNMVKGSNELTREEICLNVDEIEFHLNGGVHRPIKEVIEDIKAGEADKDGMEGF